VLVHRRFDPSNALIVAGSGRSGTTWIAEVLRDALKAMLVFEPLNGREIPEASRVGFAGAPYPRRALTHEQISFMKAACSGGIGGRWTTSRTTWTSILHKRRVVVKCIRANQCLEELVTRVGTRPALAVTRDPAAVVESTLRLGWSLNPRMLISPDLLSLVPNANALADRYSDRVSQHALWWAFDNVSLFCSTKPRTFWLTDYDEARRHPAALLGAALRGWGEGTEADLTQLARRLSSTAWQSKSSPRASQLDRTQQDQVRAVASEVVGEWYSDGGEFNSERARDRGLFLLTDLAD
jgi:hypothetical protein